MLSDRPANGAITGVAGDRDTIEAAGSGPFFVSPMALTQRRPPPIDSAHYLHDRAGERITDQAGNYVTAHGPAPDLTARRAPLATAAAPLTRRRPSLVVTSPPPQVRRDQRPSASSARSGAMASEPQWRSAHAATRATLGDSAGRVTIAARGATARRSPR